MERTYWERIAPEYDDEIFDVLKNDKKGYIKKIIRKISGRDKTVIDIGCAVGKWLPVLSPVFKEVMAVDISATNLKIARERHTHLDNIVYERNDMSKGKTKYRNYDVALCINAILTDSLKKRQVFFQNINHCLNAGGSLILVVPSLESWVLTRIIQHQWKVDKNLFKKPSAAVAARRYEEILQGNAEIDDVATKHYLGDELELLLSRQDFEIIDRKKIEYDWSTEFINPPQWLDQPRPWDWLVHAKKK